MRSLLLALALSTLAFADDGPPMAADGGPPMATATDKKCKRCPVNCDCKCQDGETCLCLTNDTPDQDGWRWTKKADGYWYQWRYVEAKPKTPLPPVAFQPRLFTPTVQTFRTPMIGATNCVGGG